MLFLSCPVDPSNTSVHHGSIMCVGSQSGWDAWATRCADGSLAPLTSHRLVTAFAAARRPKRLTIHNKKHFKKYKYFCHLCSWFPKLIYESTALRVVPPGPRHDLALSGQVFAAKRVLPSCLIALPCSSAPNCVCWRTR